MLDNKEVLKKENHSDKCNEENHIRTTVFIKIITLKFGQDIKKHFAVTKECGKTLAFLETREFAIYYCMTNNYEYFFLN